MPDIQNILHDGPLDIAMGASASSKVWKNRKVQWRDLVKKLSEPVRTPETYKAFMAMGKSDQSQVKDVGGFVGGFLKNGRRGKQDVMSRSLVALDIDFSHADFWWDFTLLYDCAAVLHSTHKSCIDKPRHRLIVPLNRKATPEEYQAVARKIAGDMNIDLFDQSTFDVNRLMFWPSVSQDMGYDFEFQDGPFLNVDSVLGTYNDWRDTTEWPMAAGQTDAILQAAKKQEDPEAKKGLIGAFCRTYSIYDAIDTFLSDKYERAGDDRYTYKGGSTAAGMVVYEGKFAYSHHGTDPAGNRLCNAFDLVRVHLFGHLDDGDGDGKSAKAMEELAAKDPLVRQCVADERLANAKLDFADAGDPGEEPEDTGWTQELELSPKGGFENSAKNLNIIMQNDARLKGAFKLNVFDNRRYVTRSMPWRQIAGLEPVRDVDYSGVRNYIECVYGIVSSQKVDDALAVEVERRKFHPIVDYLKGLEWDGTPRIDTLLIDYFGAEDNSYTRAAIRKSLCAAVARVMVPGTKFDTALILVGPQGSYKSMFVKKLGKEWFSDTFTTVQGKESFEQLQGAWVIEMAELSGLKKAEVETIKHFISKREDQFRPAYARTVETYRRQCVFFGTTNQDDFLRDATGNRRFLPIDVRPKLATKSVPDDMTGTEVDQIWAEAYQAYLAGEPLYMAGEETQIAEAEQRRHSETDSRNGVVEKYLDTLFPKDWDTMDIYDRRAWLNDPVAKKGTRIKDFTCVAEIWCECLGKEKHDMDRYKTREINEIMRSLPDWESANSTMAFPLYGKQKYYRRRDSLL